MSTSKECPCALNLITKTADCSHRLLQYIPWCISSETERVDLSHNSLNYKPKQFQRLREIAWLDLSLNKAFTPGEETFSGLSQLNAVYLNGTSCQEIQGRFVSEPSNIATLSFRNSRLSKLPTSFFSNLNHLTYLDLSQSRLTVVNDNQFSNLSSLLYLDLSYRRNLILHKHAFSGASSLETLDLSYCSMSSVQADVFAPLHKLAHLDLLFNRLTEISNYQLFHLTNLLHIDAHSNEYLRFYIDSFAGLFRLKFRSLDSICFPNFTSVSLGVFQPLTQLGELYLEGFCCLHDCETIEPSHEKTCLVLYANNKASAQSDQRLYCSLLR